MRKRNRDKPHEFDVEGYVGTAGFMDDVTMPPMPHEASLKIELFGEAATPTILLSLEAYRDTTFIIEENGSDEIGWLGSVKKLEGNKYLIEKIFLFHQEVSAAHCEFNQGDIGKFYSEMLKKNPQNKELLSSILFWGHLHPGGMTDPSSQDEEQMEVFSHNPFFIRGIFTKGGRCEFTFFDYAHGIKIVDCPWQMHVEDVDRRKEIALEIKQKVKKERVVFPKWKGGVHVQT